MTYAAGEALLLTVVQGVTGFSTTNTSRGNWLPLNSGKAAKYAVLKPGGSDYRAYIGINTNKPVHLTVIEVWEFYTQDGTTLTNLEADVQSIITAVRKSKHLGDDSKVLDSNVLTTSEVQEMWMKKGGPTWLRQRITVGWEEEEIITFQE